MPIEIVPGTRLFFQDDTERPLGSLIEAGHIVGSGGTDPARMRVYGHYALVLLLGGQGQFRDALGTRRKILPGDLITVFPDIGHSYGPVKGQRWDEIYISFHGPLFDLWVNQGIFDPKRPVQTMAEPEKAYRALRDFCLQSRPSNSAEHLHQLGRFTQIAGQLLEPGNARVMDKRWLETARGALCTDLERSVNLENVARLTGMSYESFRKAFRQETGTSPGRFRLEQRIQAAQSLLLRGDMTHATVAASLGFQDESHFSRRFKEVVGVSPRQWRTQRQP